MRDDNDTIRGIVFIGAAMFVAYALGKLVAVLIVLALT